MIFKDHKNVIWIGGQNGLCSMKKNGNDYLTTYYKLPIKTTEKEGYSVWSIIEDDKGFIWAGTYLEGLFKLENNEFKKQAISSSEPIASALDLCKDNHGNLYAATMNGVLMFNPYKHTFKLISEKDGLSSELVYAIEITKDKHYLYIVLSLFCLILR